MEDWTVLVGLSAFLTFCVSMIDHLFKVGEFCFGRSSDRCFLSGVNRSMHPSVRPCCRSLQSTSYSTHASALHLQYTS